MAGAVRPTHTSHGSQAFNVDATGVHGVYLPDKGSGEITPAVVTASMGASEHMLVIRVVNMSRTIDMLKKEDIWLAGLDLSDRLTT